MLHNTKQIDEMQKIISIQFLQYKFLGHYLTYQNKLSLQKQPSMTVYNLACLSAHPGQPDR